VIEFIIVILYERGETREILVPADADLPLWKLAEEGKIMLAKEKE
jgi:hypothetical protein